MYKLPERGFRFIYDEEKKQISLTGIDVLSQMEYFVECDLYFSEKIHNVTKDFQLCSESLNIT